MQFVGKIQSISQDRLEFFFEGQRGRGADLEAIYV
jgi:hypothetical protein